MQREIKFQFIIDGKHLSKAYTLDELLYADGEKIIDDMEGSCSCTLTESNPSCEGDCAKYENSVITGKRQHIGIKDAAGVEIYDGDVIKGQRDDVHIIEWEEKEARYVAVCGSIRCGVLQEWVTGYDKKVIGNIHQNPELLK